jgi:uncharacterized membrane protein HdeD (DUF308 family)
MASLLKNTWWMLLLRGALAILFGLMALVWTGVTLEALILLFGAYALIDGISTGATAVSNRHIDKLWWLFLLAGVVGALVGVLTFVLPTVTAVVLVYLIAARFLVVGGLEIAAAIALRREISGEWFLILNGILAVLLAIVLFMAPGAGALALVQLIGVFALLIGILLLVLAFTARRWAHNLQFIQVN